MRTSRVALVTCAELPMLWPTEEPPELDPDSEVLLPALRELGVDAVSVPWTEPGVDWSGFDRAVIRSTWDYHERPEEFARWVRAAGEATDLRNPARTILWNLDKRYLQELEAHGVPVVPTIWLEPGESGSLPAALEERGWRDVVVKPSVDLGAFQLRRTDADDAEPVAAALDGVVMVQPFLPDLERSGELSLVFLGGSFSHAIVKRPSEGDFRVQPQYGGTASPCEPPAEAVEAAHRALSAAPDLPLYARVDLVRDLAGRFCVIELELIEPFLFLPQVPETIERAARVMAEGLPRR
jgi:glutathione synthase/RimK-type ligase-like ATP-grasp enzyme